MIPWPIALLVLCYGSLAAASAATIGKVATDQVSGALVWPVGWCALSLCTLCGLALLKPWGRLLAVLGSVAGMLVALALAGLFVLSGRPGAALLATAGAGLQLVVIRYLRRPSVRAYFAQGTVASRPPHPPPSIGGPTADPPGALAGATHRSQA